MSFKLSVTYELNDNWQVLAGASLSKLDDVNENTVIIDDEASAFYVGFMCKVFYGNEKLSLRLKKGR